MLDGWVPPLLNCFIPRFQWNTVDALTMVTMTTPTKCKSKKVHSAHNVRYVPMLLPKFFLRCSAVFELCIGKKAYCESFVTTTGAKGAKIDNSAMV